jgi:nicotinamide-nucleotide amidase
VTDDDPLVGRTQAGQLVSLLLDRRDTVATAESLTAGLLAATLGGVAGVSAALRGGSILYATETKALAGHVPAEVLDQHGPVSGPTARHLAAHARAKFAATWGVSLTGVAGPEPQDGKPVGMVYVGIAGPRGERIVELALSGSRWAIRMQAVAAAINELVAELVGDHD